MSKVKYAGRLLEPIKLYRIHSHNYWEVVRYTRGSGELDIGGEKLPFREGDIFIVPPHMEHSDHSANGFQNYHYEFDDSSFSHSHLIYFPDNESGDFLSIMEIIYREFQLKRKNYEEIVDNLHQVLCCYISTLAEEKSRNKYVSLAVDSIIANFSDPNYSFATTQAEIPINEDYFRRLFERETGYTPSRYLTMVRIEHAKGLLSLRSSSGLSISEISWLSGFNDSLYFSRVFRKLTGKAPSEW